MIVIFEQDIRPLPGVGRFRWRPDWFKGQWQGETTWRICWGLWSISYYPSKGLRDFFDHARSVRTEWRNK